MKNAMIAALALAALGGCASQQQAAPAAAQQAAAAEQAPAASDDVPLTGSRIAKRKTSDRLLKTVGNTDARDSLDSAPDPLRQGQ